MAVREAVMLAQVWLCYAACNVSSYYAASRSWRISHVLSLYAGPGALVWCLLDDFAESPPRVSLLPAGSGVAGVLRIGDVRRARYSKFVAFGDSLCGYPQFV